MHFKFSFLAAVLLLTAGVAVASPGDTPPQWLQQAAAIQPPAYDKEVPGVVLRLEQNTVVNNDGKLSITTTVCGPDSHAGRSRLGQRIGECISRKAAKLMR